MSLREEAEVRHLLIDARAANEAWLRGTASGPAELSMYVSNLADRLDELLNERLAQREALQRIIDLEKPHPIPGGTIQSACGHLHRAVEIARAALAAGDPA